MTLPLSLISLFFLFINSQPISAQYLQQAWQTPSNGHLASTYSSPPFDRCCFCCCFCPVPFTQVWQQQQPFPGDKFPPSQGYGQSQQQQQQQQPFPGGENKFPPSQGYGQSPQMHPYQASNAGYHNQQPDQIGDEHTGTSMQQNKYPPSMQAARIAGSPTAGYWPSLSESNPEHGQQKQSTENSDFWQNFQGMDHPNQNKVGTKCPRPNV
ncbi:unnamed protein product [Meloidogyne enterolobii]|uniref:Uncharacterized protein n=1 Tax=Meloidogyne enterolobii TaxID=390850 RepID=A0ACB1AZF1_MELEN